MTLRYRTRFLALAALLAFTAACGEDDGPSMAEVAGEYEATVLTTTEFGGTTTDHLANGSHIHLDLAADGTTAGTMLVVGGGQGGADFTADLSGSWALHGRSITFDHTADTHLRNLVFEYRSGRIESEANLGGTIVTTVLERR